ncbi:hypothetical protein GCK72_019266 [Caenorhabditis remanei]|uniref:C-type lectin domain-containing protein n=1 Tax=Caenorhabditis remanei TaxID=31234 RepID=A0A6A5GDA6_CAERE|nr:hypothetical protein GCK72_019266 [Caenorhabditis remanei]KAF1752711.1 hypothetical protein GCK72_019266 [Caenorhabditis remanei]
MLKSGAAECPDNLLNAISLEEVNGKCIAVTSRPSKGSGTTQCTYVTSIPNQFTFLSIDSKTENDHIQQGLAMTNFTFAYIDLGFSGSTWSWMNGDTSAYTNWANPPVTQPPTIGPTTVPFLSTLPPSQQRRSTAVVIGIDASLFSTNSLTLAQVNFARSLSTYIAERGPSEFAIFAYGCTQATSYITQYPNFVNAFTTTNAMISNVDQMINIDCVRSSPLDFPSMFRDQTVYYNRYSTSYRPFKSKFLSMVYFSSSTDSDNIKLASALYPMANSSIITINVGDSSIDISRLSIPVGKYGLRVKTADDIMALVPKVDSMIFGATAFSSAAVKMDNMREPIWNFGIQTKKEPSVYATGYTDCAYMNATDGLWYSDGNCDTKRQVLCQYVLPVPPAPPTVNPTISWQDPCYIETTNFTYFQSLSNAKCYRMSASKKQFAEAEDVCLTDHPLFLHTPKLTSIETKAEEDQVRTMLSPLTSEGMFWFGLKRDPSNSSNWNFINGDIYDSSYSNWRDGYPRDADGCDCVALVNRLDSCLHSTVDSDRLSGYVTGFVGNQERNSFSALVRITESALGNLG